MKTFVTGASGNVGFPLIRYLHQAHVEIKAGSTDPVALGTRLPVEVECVDFDFLNPESYDAALHDVDRVFLMRPPHLGNPNQLYPFIDAMVERGIGFVVFLSLMGIEKNPVPPHAKIEKYIRASGLNHAFVRPGFFMQNVSGVHAWEICRNDEILIPAGRAKTSFVDAEDVALAASMILQDPLCHAKKAYTITGPRSLDYDDIATLLSKVTGRTVTYRKPGFLTYRNHMINVRKLDRTYVDVTIALYFMTRLNTASKVTGDFERLCGKTATDFEDFVIRNKGKFEKSPE
ncbi:MAG: SDR family oxidoreductase [Erysipelotrichaceae bacterium]|nr:SDR family oxidoreductase [Erysipelotrichaceae bacterium]